MSKETSTRSAAEERQARLSAALRANLRRRKEQSRAQSRLDPAKSAGDAGAPAVKPDAANPDTDQ